MNENSHSTTVLAGLDSVRGLTQTSFASYSWNALAPITSAAVPP
jgi:hypothetical protein